jgi:hypothetical protein
MALAVLVDKFEDGKIKRGHVVNGGWYLHRDGEYCYSLDLSQTNPSRGWVNRWEDSPDNNFYVEIPQDKQKDYNEAIAYGISIWEEAKSKIPERLSFLGHMQVIDQTYLDNAYIGLGIKNGNVHGS